jgi:hypothetical protein
MIRSLSKYFYSPKGSVYLFTVRKRRVKYHRGKRRIRKNNSSHYRCEALFRNIVYFNRSFTGLRMKRKRFISNRFNICVSHIRKSILASDSKEWSAKVDYNRVAIRRKLRRSLYHNQYISKYNSRGAYIALFLNLLLRRRSVRYKNLWIRRRRLFNSFLAMLRHYGGKRWFVKAESFKEMFLLFRMCKPIRTFPDTQFESNKKNFDYCLPNHSYIYNSRRMKTIAVGRAKRRRRSFIRFLKSNFPYYYTMEQHKNLLNSNYQRQIEYRSKDSCAYDPWDAHGNGIYYYNLYYNRLNSLKDQDTQ